MATATAHQFSTPSDVSAIDTVFGGNITKLMPRMKDIPEEFKTFDGGKWGQLVSVWFFKGLGGAKFYPKPGIDTDQALAHLAAIMRSWEPKHEHKTAAVAYLMSLWFEDIKTA